MSAALSAAPALAQDASVPTREGRPVGAADTSTPQAAPSDDPNRGDIIVTANKRAEAASKVPVAISVLQGDSLKTLGVQSVSDLQNVTPGVNIGRDGFGVNINIRGVTTTDTTSKGEQGIAYNVDGIFIGRPIVQGLAFFDINRIEVLRGPQGTLYGKSTTGGAIHVITNKPVDQFEAYTRLELGNYNTVRAEGAVNVPVTDWLAVRAAGNVNKRNGFIRPTDGSRAKSDQRDETLRLSALAQFATDLTARLTFTAGHVGGAGAGTVLFGTLMSNASTKQKLRVFPNPFPAQLDDDFTNIDGEVNLGLGGVLLTYVGAHQFFRAHERGSSNNDPLGNYQGPPPAQPFYNWRYYRGKFKTDQHEVRLSNDTPGFLDYVVGANYYRGNIRESDHNWTAPANNPTYEASRNAIDPVNTTRHTSWGVFGQATAHVTDRHGIVAGLRYSNDEVRRIGTFAAGPGPWPDPQGGVCTAFEDCIGGPNNGYQKAGKLTYRAGVNFQATPTDLFYASVASGYKAGGFNDFDPVTNGVGEYGSEALTAFEAGYKGRPIRNLQLNSSLFYYDYSKTQLSSLVNISGNFVIFTRLVPTEIYGWENEATWNIGANTSIGATAALEGSKYRQLKAGLLQNVDWSGLSLDKTPTFVGALTLNHAWQLAEGFALRLRAFSKYSSGYAVSNFVTPYRYKQGSFTRSELSLTLAAPEDRWTVQVFVTNIENDLQAIGAPGNYNAALPNGSPIAVSEPRFYGIRLATKF